MSNRTAEQPRRKNVELDDLGAPFSVPLTDTLHHCRREEAGKLTDTCTGSMLQAGGRGPLATTKEVMVQARDFIEKYYADEINSRPEMEKDLRMCEVMRSITSTGEYEHTTNELSWACKTAWRNAPRCVGRSMWKTLALRDERGTNPTCKDIFDTICKNLRETFNNGKIIPTAVIFEQRRWNKREGTGIRIWNTVILGFAGHEQENGDVFGDPKGVFLCNVAKSMGWNPKEDRFELLPLVITDGNENTEMFELPEDIKRFTVEIRHPTIPAITNMGLKWYAVPSVASMMLEAGGIQYTCATIAGFFQDTEVSVLNLLNYGRYGLLETTGRAMGLDVTTNTNFWKMEVSLEMTRAVFESYRAAGVTIVDHLTISENFHSFMKEEIRIRGGCPTDWLWVVPPLSGGLVPTFHNEMLRYTLSPSYEYQPGPDSYFVNKIKYRPSFFALSWAVFFYISKITKRIKARKLITLVYATETGTSQKYTNIAADLFKHVFNVQVMSMDEINKDEEDFYARINNSTAVIMIASTFGTGEPPTMGLTFSEQLKEGKAQFKDLNYAVFGLGSSLYPDIAGFGKFLFQKIENLGGVPLVAEMGLGDDQGNQQLAFETWIENLYELCCTRFTSASHNTSKSTTSHTKYRWRLDNPQSVRDAIQTNVGTAGAVKEFKLDAVSNISLNNKNNDRYYLLEFSYDTSKEGEEDYYPGEHIAVFPQNSKSSVAKIREIMKDQPFDDVPLKMEEKSVSFNSWVKCASASGLTFEEHLTHLIDLNRIPIVPIVDYLEGVQALNKDEVINLTMKYDAQDVQAMVLAGARVSSAGLTGRLSDMSKRIYSIASCPTQRGKVAILIAMAEYEKRGETKLGLCSRSFKDMEVGQSMYGTFIAMDSQMKPPTDLKIPMILVSAGSGWAPFQSFIDHRVKMALEGQKTGKILIYHGARTKDEDFLEQLIKPAKDTLDIELNLALSREPGISKSYVQDLIETDFKQIAHYLQKKSACFYVCGREQVGLK